MSTYISEEYGRNNIYAKVVAHSRNPYVPNAPDLYTLELNYHRFIHGEVMTHRQFSRNASSSRAIPVKRSNKTITETPAIPIHWGKNKAGMQADGEQNVPVIIDGISYSPEEAWLLHNNYSTKVSNAFDTAGYHKQIANRLPEPHAFIRVVVSATEWSNFFRLRIHKDAQPEIQELARCMKEAMLKSTPTIMSIEEAGINWHLPYISPYEIEKARHGVYTMEQLCKVSTARCARVSYLTHNKEQPNIDKDIILHDDLLSAKHMSPFEHPNKLIADYDPETPPEGATHRDLDGNWWSGNVKQWAQYRHIMSG